MKKLLVFLLVTFSFNMNVFADSICSYQEQTELYQKAANIRTTYEIEKQTMEMVDGTMTYNVFKVSILNITEDFYVVVKNNVTDEEKIFKYEDTEDGIASFIWDNENVVTNFTIEVYTTDNTSCPNERYKVAYQTTPRYNKYHNIEICQELTDFYLCQEYVTTQEVDQETFLNRVHSYQNGEVNDNGEEIENPKDLTFFDKTLNFLNNYKWVLTGIAIVTITGIIIYQTINKKKGKKNSKKKQRDLGL